MDKIKELFAKNKEIIIPTFVMVCICIVVTLALSLTNSLTKEKIVEIEAKTQNDSMKEVLTADSYDKLSVTYENEKIEYYEAKKDGKTEGYIFVIAEKGYGGDVKVMCAVNTDNTVKSVKVLDATSETPGLGQNTANESFYSQYGGLKKGISVLKSGGSKDANTINAVTGATISSKAVTSAVNKSLDYCGAVIKASESEGK